MIKEKIATVYRTPTGDEFFTLEEAVAHQLAHDVLGLSRGGADAIVQEPARVIELLSLLQPTWKEWGGKGARPIGHVEVRLRDGSATRGEASSFNWSHRETVGDILAWRPL